MKRDGFTIIEMLVAIGLLTALLAGSAVIFGISVQAQRTAKATSEISRRLRAITDQLNADFAGLQKDAPLAIWFEYDSITNNRHDQILFFADGDFQTTKQYKSTDNTIIGTISGNVARVYYGQADEIDYTNRTNTEKAVVNGYKTFNTLARRQHILTDEVQDVSSNAKLVMFPDPTNNNFVKTFIPFRDNDPEILDDDFGNDVFEYDAVPLSWWQGAGNDININGMDFRDRLLTTCFEITNDIGRPGIDFAAGQTLHMLMAEGVGSFEIQWSSPMGQWWPGADPDGDGVDNDFAFGHYFNMADGVNLVNWGVFPFFPRALKFTFTLYDSLGIYESGKRFTHIVYLDD